MATVMEEFDLLEISAVDRPAQAHAKAVIIKRAPKKGEPGYQTKAKFGDEAEDMSAEDEDDTDKKGKGKKKKPAKKSDEFGEMRALVLTSGEDGHSHLLRIAPGQSGGSLEYSTSDAAGIKGGSHDHPWAFNSSGNVEIGMADGHLHVVDMETVNQALLRMLKTDSEEDKSSSSDATAAPAAIMEGESMPEAQKSEELVTLQAQNDELTQRAERAESISALKSDERAHFDGLDEAGQSDFIGKSSDERVEILKAAADSDPVVFKSANGEEFRKSDDPRLVKMAQERDEDRAIAKADRDAREALELAKRANEVLGNLPGDEAVRGQLLKAVESIEDEDTRNGALECLKAANSGIFERAGGSPEDSGLSKGQGMKPTEGGAEAQLTVMVEKFASENSVPEYKAWDQVLKTEEGIALYQKSTTER